TPPRPPSTSTLFPYTTLFRSAAQTLTTSEFWVEDNAPAATLALYGSVTQVLQALSSSSADIVVIDKPAADGIAKANSAFKVQGRSEEHTSELQSRFDLVCRLL